MQSLRNQKAGMAFILVTMLLDVIGFGIVIPVLPHLVTRLGGGDPSEASVWFGALAATFAVMQFLFAPVLGGLSDRFGRRPVMLFSLFGFGVGYVIMALAPTLPWLFASRVLSGITGASFTTANAYIADISTPKNRAHNFGLVGATFGLGFIIGPALGGVLGELDPRLPFWVSAAIVLVNWLYGFLVLPESLPPERRRSVGFKDANPLGGLRLLGRYPVVAGLAVAFVFFALGQRGMESVFVLYTQYRFHWSELENGLGMALVGLMALIVQGGLIRRVVPLLGERRAAVIGIGISSVAMVLYGLANQGWMVLAAIVVGAFGGIGGPAIQGIIAGQVGPSEQGGVQGALTSLISLTAIFAPVLSTQLFARFTGPNAWYELPGMPFFACSVFFLLGLLTVAAVFRRHKAADPLTATPALSES